MNNKNLLVIILVIIATSILSGCNNSQSIKYNSVSYIKCENPSIDDKELNSIATGIGSLKGSDVYKINGESDKDWIYLYSQSMSDSPVGLYKSSKVKMNTLKDFKADELIILDISYNNQKIILKTQNRVLITKVIDCINNGKHIEPSNNMDIKTERNIEFRSDKFPNLVYSYDYIVSKDEKYYLSYEKDTIEINDEINKLISKNMN